jgi:hypothetical protein
MTRLRRLAMICGPAAVRTWERSSSKPMSRPVQAVFDTPVAADDGGELARGGLGGGQGGDRVAGFTRPFSFHCAVAGDLEGLGGVREGQPPGDGGDLEDAPLAAAVPAFPPVIRGRHVTPGQGGELGVQAGLVALDGDHIVRAATGQVAGVLALGVQRVGGDHRVLDLDAVAQRGEQRDLIRLGAHLHLAQHHTVGMVQGGQQVTAGPLAIAGAA